MCPRSSLFRSTCQTDTSQDEMTAKDGSDIFRGDFVVFIRRVHARFVTLPSNFRTSSRTEWFTFYFQYLLSFYSIVEAKH